MARRAAERASPPAVAGRGRQRFSALPEAARAGIIAVMADLAAGGLTEEMLDRVEIVLAEAVNNVVEHAYAGRDTGDVGVDYHLSQDRLTILVTDTGHPFPEESLPPGQPAPIDGPRDSLPEGGFGWLLIRKLASHVSYRRHGATNLLTIGFDAPARRA